METQGPIGRDVVAPYSLCILGHYSLRVWAHEKVEVQYASNSPEIARKVPCCCIEEQIVERWQ
jgi:hypothetical protein